MPNQVYPNFVLKKKVESVLETNLSMLPFITVNRDLKKQPGDTVKINVYKPTGVVQEVGLGEGNTEKITVGLSQVEYRVQMVQGYFRWQDEEEYIDPNVVTVGLEGLADTMTNFWFDKYINEYRKAELVLPATTPNFDMFVDAESLMQLESSENLFAFVSPTMKGAIKKALKDELRYVEAYVRTGYVGNVNNIAIYTTKGVKDDEIFIATKEAVTYFIGKSVQIEQDRDANTRTNDVYARNNAVVALTNAAKVVKAKFYTKLETARVETVAGITAGSTVLVPHGVPDGYKVVYKLGTAAETVTYGTAVSGYTEFTGDEIALGENTHITVAYVDATNKPVEAVTLTGEQIIAG